MTREIRRRVCRWLGTLALAAISLTPREASAAPIVMPVDPTSAVIAGNLIFDNDVAFIQFVLGDGPFLFSAFTTSAGAAFDPILTLFGPGGLPMTYTTPLGEVFPAQWLELAPDVDPATPALTLEGAGTYTLAISQFGPFDGNFAAGALQDGFTQDAFPCFTFDPFAEGACTSGDPNMFGGLGGPGGAFSLNLTLAPADIEPIPEPGTLSLMAVGSAGAAWLRRRRRKTRRS